MTVHTLLYVSIWILDLVVFVLMALKKLDSSVNVCINFLLSIVLLKLE